VDDPKRASSFAAATRPRPTLAEKVGDGLPRIRTLRGRGARLRSGTEPARRETGRLFRILPGGLYVGFVSRTVRVLKKGRGHPHRQSLLRDRPLDRRRTQPPETLTMAQPPALAMAALRCRFRVPAATTDDRPCLTSSFLPTLRAILRGTSEGRQPKAARRFGSPPGQRGDLVVPVRSAGGVQPKGRADRPRGDDAIGCRRSISRPVFARPPSSEESGRYGIPELFKLKDRNDRNFRLPLDARGVVSLFRSRFFRASTAYARSFGTTSRRTSLRASARRAASSASRVHHEGSYSFESRTRRGSTSAVQKNRGLVPPNLDVCGIATLDVAGGVGG